MEDVSCNEMIVGRDIGMRDYRDRERERDRRGIDEILMLRKQLDNLKNEVSLLKKENSDLRATNDFLLEKVCIINLK